MPAKKPNLAAAIAKITANKTHIPALAECEVKNGLLTATNLTVWLRLKTTLANGMYKVIGNDFVPTNTKDDYPTIIEIKGDVLYKITTEILADVLKKAVPFISKVQTRLNLTGIFLEAKNGEVAVTATDSHQLFRQCVRAKVLTDSKFIISSPRLVSNVVEVLGDLIEVSYEKPWIKFAGENGYLVIREIVEDYPDTPSIYPKFVHCYEFERQDMIEAIKVLLPYAKQQKFPRIKLTAYPGQITLAYESNTGVANIKKEISVPVSRQDVKAANGVVDGVLVMPIKNEGKQTILNPIFVANALKALNSNLCCLHQCAKPFETILLFTNN